MKKFGLILLLFCAGLPAFAQLKQLPDWALGPFKRPEGVNPVITPDSTTTFADPMSGGQIKWEANDTFNPGAVVKGNKICVLYRAEDRSGVGIGHRTSRLGLAESTDGLHMHRRKTPVLFPANDKAKEFEWHGGCEDPRVSVTADGTYLVLYTEWNNKVPRLGAATSRDLVHWHKGGPIFARAYNGKFRDIATKSASVITKIQNGKLTMARIKGKYFMYWGEQHVYGATSTDLLHWTPLIEADSSLKILLSPRKGYFDSQLTECGPPAVMTPKGIILIYNGKSGSDDGDKEFTPNAYCAGQILFDRNDPEKYITRLDKPFMIPEASFEKSGQYPAGTVFMEGLAYFHHKWFIYYGCADSRVSVAVWEPEKK